MITTPGSGQAAPAIDARPRPEPVVWRMSLDVRQPRLLQQRMFECETVVFGRTPMTDRAPIAVYAVAELARGY